MLISHAHKFILLSPWKTASSTCHDSLESYNESGYDRFFRVQPLPEQGRSPAPDLAELLALPEGRMDYKIGSFVRNPYDRAFSGFLQIQRDFEIQPRTKFPSGWIGDLVRTQITENMSRVISAGFDFDRWLQLLPDYEIFEVGRNTNMVLHLDTIGHTSTGYNALDSLVRSRVSKPILPTFASMLV